MFSMTGYAQRQIDFEDYTLMVEMKSLNNKYLELRFHLPYGFESLEYDLRKLVKSVISRGKLDAYLRVTVQKSKEIEIVKELIAYYYEIIKQAEEQIQASINFSIADILSLKNYLNPYDQLGAAKDIPREVISKLFMDALKDLLEERKREGEATKKNIEECIKNIENDIKDIEERYPKTVDKFKENLREKITELIDDKVDETRIMMEVGIYANKIDINEEIIRLKEHLKKMKKTINLNQPIGRNLDFIVQEMHREINTIGSKVPDYFISEKVVDVKSQLEKIKEQVRNIE